MKNISLSCFMIEVELQHSCFTFCLFQPPEIRKHTFPIRRLPSHDVLWGSLMPKTHRRPRYVTWFHRGNLIWKMMAGWERREDEESREGYREEEAEWVPSSAERDVMASADVFHYKKRFYIDLNHSVFLRINRVSGWCREKRRFPPRFSGLISNLLLTHLQF